MAYIDLFILLSRYIFIGFMIIFLYISSTFILDIPYRLSVLDKQKVRIQYVCILFFTIASYAILIAKESEKIIQIELARNGLIFIGISILTGVVLKLLKRNREIPMYNIIIFLMNIGVVMLERLNHHEATKQIVWCALGISLALFIPRLFKYFINPKFKNVYLILGWVFILSPFLLGQTKHGANNWIMIGEYGFQPSEAVKILLVFYLAASLKNPILKKSDYKQLIMPILMVGGFLLSLVLQKDLGGALIYFITALTVIYISTGSLFIYISGIFSGLIGAVIGYNLFYHVRVRVEAWLNPWKDISGKGYQIAQSLFAIGTWGWLGSGLTRGYPTKIPIVTSDFIFAAISEEFGNIFSIGVILLFVILILYSIKIILSIQNRFYILIGVGLINLIAIQVVLIIGGVIKLIPLTGITLPFVSYGGSSMIVSVFIIGTLQFLADSIWKTRNEGA